MKKYIKFLVIILLIIFSGNACQDMMETDSPSQFTEQSVFSNLDFAQKAVYSISEVLTKTELYGTMLLYVTVDSDIEFNLNTGSSSDLSHYSGTPETQWLSNMWNALYLMVERANICIDNLPNSPLWTGEYANEARRLYGEAVTLRAFAYNWLIGLWGDVPFPIKSVQGDDNFYVQKADRDSIYEYLIEDLKNVEDYVPWMNQILSTDRVGKGFVKGLRAKMALNYAGYSLRNKTHETRRGRYWQEYYQIARDECQQIMESSRHQLNPSFENIFRTLQSYKQDLTYGEILYEIPWARNYGGVLGYTVGMRFSTGDTKYGRASPQLYTSPQYFYSFDKADTRRNVSTELYNYSGTTVNLSKQMLLGITANRELTKWRKSWMTPTWGGDLMGATNFGVGQPLMRYSDVILMFAEAENEINNGPTPAAIEALSQVRRRAFPSGLWQTKVVNYANSVSTSKESFFNAVVDERAWEFGGGELIRKFDLIRWNLLGPKIAEMKAELAKITTLDDLKYKDNVSQYIFWKRNDDGERIDILNTDYAMPATPIPAGYTRAAWLPTWTTSQKSTYYAIYDRVGQGYDVTKNNHLLPIAATIIDASRGTLDNDQIP